MQKNTPVYRYGLEQEKYINKIKDYFHDLYPKKEMCAFIKTYGCQQNVSDSEKYRAMLVNMGFKITDCKETADLILLNTCAIRENAENKVFGNIGWIKNIKKNNPNLITVVCGCMTEQDNIINKIKLVYSFVDLVFGTHSIHKFPEMLYDAIVNKSKSKIYIKDNQDMIFEGAPSIRNNNLKAFLSIMYGCNNFCSYCIVPYVRGRERSRSPEEILCEFNNLLNAGYKDITLLGQNVNSYGRGLTEDINFPKLLKKLDDVEGDFKIRFMTSHPKDASKELFDVIAESKHIAHHIHLPVQCGNNRVLEAMNRKYTRDLYLEIIDYARKKISDMVFTSDIIVGFPGETYNEFLDTIKLIQEVKFASLFTFIYSPRKGTPAAMLEDPMSKSEKTEWLLQLLKVQEEISKNLLSEMVGKKVTVLAESFVKENGMLLCRTDGNIIAEVFGDKNLVGKFFDIKIADAKKESLVGEIIK